MATQENLLNLLKITVFIFWQWKSIKVFFFFFPFIKQMEEGNWNLSSPNEKNPVIPLNQEKDW